MELAPHSVYPSAVFYLSPGLAERQLALPAGQSLSDTPPPQWSDQLDQAVLGPTRHVSEVAFFHHKSQTLVLAEMLLRDRPLVGKFVWRLLTWPFERIIVTHGDVLESGGRGALESAFAAYLQ